MAGTGGVVVLIHGGGLDSRMWDREFEDLAREFRVIRYDVRGFGRSSPGAEPFSHVEDLRRVLDAAGAGSVSLVGLSLGGAIALNFALVHPDRAERLLLAGPAVPGASFPPDEPERFQRIGRLASEGRTRDAVEEWLGSTHMRPAMENPRIAERVRELARQNHATWGPPPAPSLPVTPAAAGRLDEVRARVFVIVGARDDRSVRKQAALVAGAVAGAECEVVEGAGHILNLEAPQAFARWLRRGLGAP